MTDVEEDVRRLREIEQATREEVEELPEFDVVVEPFIQNSVDTRDFVDEMVYDHTPNGRSRKKIYFAWCEGNKVPEVPPDTICVLLNYKLKRGVGKKDPLGGNHVVVVPTSKGPRITPIHLLRKYALNMLRMTDAIEDGLAELDISMIPDVEV